MDSENRYSDQQNTEARERRLQRWRRLQRQAADFTASLPMVPPFPLTQLTALAATLAGSLGINDDTEKKLLAVMIHNEAWRDSVAAVPFERRLLLLPQCLRSREHCSAAADEFGLLCNECGQCPLGELQKTADELGYLILIAEGTAAVTGLLRQGRLDAVIGASCFSALEESFARIVEEAIPALAVPLLNNGCDRTDVDLQMLYANILTPVKTGVPAPPSLEEIRTIVTQWFEPDSLRSVLNPEQGHAMEVAWLWLSRPGKRWRPLLTAAVYAALDEAPDFTGTALVRRAAVATELFHKASLIHDDIEDNDDFRYEMETMHRQYGVAIALNAGDLLIGKGYGLLTEGTGNDAARLAMLRVAAEAHRRLCLGQGEELQWMRHPDLPDTGRIIRIFRNKTVPSFEAAILLGAIAGGASEETRAGLTEFSQALGIAYQIRDDLLDIQKDTDWDRECIRQPSIALALLCEKCPAGERREIMDLLISKDSRSFKSGRLKARCEQYAVVPAAEALLSDYRHRAIESLKPLTSIRLKSMLTRLIKKILPP